VTQTDNIITFTEVTAELFEHDDGEFPSLISVVTAPLTSEIVDSLITRMLPLFDESTDLVEVTFLHATKITHKESSEDTLLTPNTLVLILGYSEERERVITLELASTKEELRIH
jgi:hypothetical protein